MSPDKTTKAQVLDLLKKDNTWVSGENISQALGVSRAAVAKHVATLRSEGYWIEAASRRGYLLKMEPDALDVVLLQQSINTKIIGQGKWLCLEKTTSTNDEAASLGAKGAPDGSLVLTLFQTNGRGRKGRFWFSAPRSLHFSVLLRPGLPARKLSLLTLMACLAVQKVLADLTGLRPCLKWPNDILLNNKKVAAVLVESNIIGGETAWATLGIGCNLNASRTEFPEELREKTTSVFEETGKIFSRNRFCQSLLTALDGYYTMLLRNEVESLLTQWQEKTDILGKKLDLQVNNQIISGKVLSINEDGLLRLQDSAGKEHLIEVADYLAS